MPAAMNMSPEKKSFWLLIFMLSPVTGFEPADFPVKAPFP
jgi:hypothetical protein